jgi:drug/metabolite transporter (DMT)-like permease
MLVLGEKPGAAEWAALVLILAALGVVVMPGRNGRGVAEPPPVKVD